MKLAIMQPTYLPWMGYFDLMDQVDTFVILDTVSLSKQSFQQRNRIKGADGSIWLTIPILSHQKLGQKIGETKIANKLFIKKHLKSIELSYRKAPFFEVYFPELTRLYEHCSNSDALLHFNLSLIEWIKDKLGIKTTVILASTLEDIEDTRGGRLIDICQYFKAKTYITPKGAVGYLEHDSKDFLKKNIHIQIQNYEHPAYNQLYPPFLSHLSVLDVLMNEGDQAMNIIKSGRNILLEMHNDIGQSHDAVVCY
jgi:hypothetical protein